MKTTKSNAAVLKKDAAKETRKVGPVSKSQWDYKKSLLYKKGGSFPDLTGDGKVTRADVLKGRGVFKKGGSTHPGFKAVQSSIAKKQGVSKQAAGAILAASTRKASAAAKRANPRLKRVKG